MDARDVVVDSEHLLTLEDGDDWRDAIEEFAAAEDVRGAWFAGYGTVRDADLWQYDPDREEHRTVRFDEPLTVAACVGTVGDDDGPVARPYATLSRPSGQGLAGYLNAASVVEGELYLRAFAGPIPRGEP
jgi:predicted DNA-binding protein with PD1-like motif